MAGISRRGFLAGLGAVGGVALSGKWAIADPHKPTLKSGVDMITLGRTGLKTSVLGVGTGTVGGSQQLAMGSEGFGKMLRYAL
ncbi:MAG TPA: twin-arginine translocation signal domain-containing protein, partial [Thermogutta sp.]|nr:twin-arginine translocation signal domain-containing protein [Thermogutta sp.]